MRHHHPALRQALRLGAGRRRRERPVPVRGRRRGAAARAAGGRVVLAMLAGRRARVGVALLVVPQPEDGLRRAAGGPKMPRVGMRPAHRPQRGVCEQAGGFARAPGRRDSVGWVGAAPYVHITWADLPRRAAKTCQAATDPYFF